MLDPLLSVTAHQFRGGLGDVYLGVDDTPEELLISGSLLILDKCADNVFVVSD